MRGFAGSRRGCVRVGAMEEREQRRRCRGQNEAGERDLLQEAAGGIPRALAMTDGRVVHGAAEACMAGFLASGASVSKLERLQATR